MAVFNLTKYISSVENLKRLFPPDVVKLMTNIFNPCCGFGVAHVALKDVNGDVARATFPLTYNAVVCNTEAEFLQAVSESFGYGYIAYMTNPFQLLVLGNSLLKNDLDGGLDGIPTSIVIS